MEAVKVVDKFNAPGGPDCMDLSPDGRFIYLSSRWARYLTVIDTQTKQIVRRVRVGRSPHGVWTLDHAPR
jgi:YVTN family beta-propeller protein